ncbi:MAG: hypothetical protein JKX74_02240, partial [Flavobacteriales bacterium]|nr:hypothetical protein [Flavobacteriales bacterium]
MRGINAILKMFGGYTLLLRVTFVMGMLAVSFLQSFAGGGAPLYGVSAFPDQYFCTAGVYPTPFVNVGTFSIYETDNKGFKKSQTETIIITAPTNFEFNPAAPHSVTFIPAKDITAISLDAVTPTTITITVSTDGNEGEIDAILFNNFEMRATGVGTGNVLRVDGAGGDFKIDGSDDNPTNSESLGFVYSDVPMIYDSSEVYTVTTSIIKKTCPLNHGIIEIEVSMQGNCPDSVTRFDFHTAATTNPAGDLLTAKVYYTGTTRGFATSNQFGSTFALPNGAFTITGSQQLVDGADDYYFYLVYDINPAATAGNIVDARLDSFKVTDVFRTDMDVSDPVGSRTISDDLCLIPDLPNPPANMQMIDSGSLIIPMDTANQSFVAGTMFNMKAYGLVHDLLLNDIPVKWIIRSGKAKNDTDFRVLSRRVWPDTTALVATDFYAGAFIIDSQYIDSKANQFVKTARKVIDDWRRNVVVMQMGQNRSLDVRYTNTQRPKMAVFSNGGNQDIHQAILDTGGVTNYIIIDAGAFPGINECYTFGSEPHWSSGDPPDIADTAITNVIKRFVDDGGNFLAQCHGISQYENLSFFQTDLGTIKINKGSAGLFYNPDLAFMQMQGDMTIGAGGSVPSFERNVGSSYNTGFYRAVSYDGPDSLLATGAHIIAADSVGGNVFYISGHNYAPYDNLGDINMARMYLNATLIPAGRPTNFALDPGPADTICVGDSVQLGGSPTGPPGSSYQWSPGLTLDDSTIANPWAKPTDTTTYSVLATNGGCVVGPLPVKIVVNPVPTAAAGVDQTVCAEVPSVAVSGTVTQATGGLWSSTTGTGTFDDNTDLTTNYNPSVADTALGSIYIKLTTVGAVGCGNKSDSLLLTFTPSPKAVAGPDQTKCSNNRVTVLAGAVYNTGGGLWTTGGAGTFVDDTDPTTTYTPSDADTTAGAVTLTLTTTATGGCAVDSDPMTITLTDAPKVNAGIDQSVCADIVNTAVSGTVTVATGGAWTSDGTGTFAVPGALATTYDPSDADTADGFIILTLTSTGNGLCAAESDVLNLTITPEPTANAGVDQTVCANNAAAVMAGSKTTATGVLWTTSGTGTFDDNTSLVAVYTPSAADTTAPGSATITLTMTTTGNGSCLAVNDAMILTITDAPRAIAGPDQSVCANNEVVTLAGAVTIATGGSWLTLGGGSFGNPLLLATTYTPSAADIAAGTDTVVLTTTGNGTCLAATDTLVITITAAPTVSANVNQTVCANNNAVTLAGSVTVATGGLWTTPGDGVFVDPAVLGTTYTPGTGDNGAGTVTLTLTTTGNGTCVAVSDIMVITIDPAPTVNAGLDQTKCSNNRVTSLSGSFTVAASVLWTSTGTGVFADPTNPITTYTPSDADTTNGTDTLILTTSGPVLCGAEVDTMILTLTRAPKVNANVDQTVCASAPAITLAGTTYNSAGALWTVTFPAVPDGVFDNPTLLGAVYTPGAGDIAAGSVIFQLATTGNGPCIEVTDAMTATINAVATAAAGADNSVCSGSSYTLLGSIGGSASTLLWTNGGGDGVFDDATLAGATYTPGAGDIAATTVTLTITSDDPDGAGPCAAATDLMILTINPVATASAGADATICEGSTHTLAGAIGGSASTLTWTTSGTGVFDDATIVGATYTPSAADIVALGVTLTITTDDPDGAGACVPAVDAMVLTINLVATVGANIDATICEGSTYTLAGVMGGSASSIIWTTSG